VSDQEAVLAADARRRAAMVAGDATALGALLDDDLIWTHSSGKTDGKRSFLEGIASGTVRYLSLEADGVGVIQRGNVFICHGLLNGRASRDGVEKTLSNRFLAVWERTESGFRMVAWQSTGL
jgi:ketosteroid isomerase-like protein